MAFVSLLWCGLRRKNSSTPAGFTVECLPRCTSMQFTTQTRGHTPRANMLSQCSALFNMYLLCCFPFSLVHMCECTIHFQRGSSLPHILTTLSGFLALRPLSYYKHVVNFESLSYTNWAYISMSGRKHYNCCCGLFSMLKYACDAKLQWDNTLKQGIIT